MRFYLQFQNPLDIVAQKWHERNIDVGDMSFTMDFLWERRGEVMENNAFFHNEPQDYEWLIPVELEEIPNPSPLLLEQLHKKMSVEYKCFLNEMKSKPAEDILVAAYEKVFKEDLLTIIENIWLSDEQISALLTLDKPLADLYSNWQDAETSHMDMLRDSVDEYANAVISELKAEQAKTEPVKPVKPKQQQLPAPKQPPSLLGEVREAAREVEARKVAQTAPTTKKAKENEL